MTQFFAPSPRALRLMTTLVAAAALAACGGGDDDDDDRPVNPDATLNRGNFEAVATTAADALNLDMDLLDRGLIAAAYLSATPLKGDQTQAVAGCGVEGEIRVEIEDKNRNGKFDRGDEAELHYDRCIERQNGPRVTGSVDVDVLATPETDGNGDVVTGHYRFDYDWRMDDLPMDGNVELNWSGASAELRYESFRTRNRGYEVTYGHTNRLTVVESEPLTYSHTISGPFNWTNENYTVTTPKTVLTVVDRQNQRNHQQGVLRVTDRAGGYVDIDIKDNALRLDLHEAR